MYFNLENELKEKNISIGKLAKELEISSLLMLLKLKGIYKINFEEAVKIKIYIKSDMKIEELFATQLEYTG